jgi:uncharacterized protein
MDTCSPHSLAAAVAPLRGIPLLFCGLLAAATSAYAVTPAFDCTKAVRDAERTICGNAGLARMDSHASALYRDLMETVHAELRKGLQRTQLDFLRERNDCRANVPCLESAYLFRSVELCGIAKLYGRPCAREGPLPR